MSSEVNTDIPFQSLEEHLNGCMAWIDECLSIFGEHSSASASSLRLSQKHLFARQEASPDIPLPLVRLRHMISMTDFEYFAFLLALVQELDIKYEYIYATLQGNPATIHPTLGLARSVYSFIEPVTFSMLERITDSSSLLNRYCFDQTAAGAAGETTLHRNLILKKTVLRWLLGYSGASGIDGLTKVYLSDIPTSDLICYPDQLHTIELSASSLTAQSGSCTIVHLSGEMGAGRKYLLSQMIRQNAGLGGKIPGSEILSIDMRALHLMEKEQFSQTLDELSLETLLWNRSVHIDHIYLNSADDANYLRQTIIRLSENCPLLFLSANADKISDVTDAPIVHVNFPILEGGVRGKLWENLGCDCQFSSDVNLESFGHRYRLSPGRIARILAEAAQMALASRSQITRSLLESAVSQNQVLSFGSLASKIEKLYTWDDLQIADSQKQLLHSACSRLKMKYQVETQWGFGQKSAYGKGLSILFYGPPGTGKTMAAQVIACESGLDLYRVDLSQILNKYIGETEKNIGNVFNEAKNADIILFFDEADALFSKRTDVTNSNDRHSNAEISYLLQKMEEYDGVTILSTNLYRNFDSAFLRRLTYTVHFDMPDEKTRLLLWKSMIPDRAPVSAAIEWKHLAKQFELSGSAIKSILRGAAYLAAEEGTEIRTGHVIRSMKYEFLKIGKMVSNEEFGEFGIYL